ncbi:MAG: sigma-70 family RNA polymerase sigma factor, partial [Phycisphaeraceae bacterium]|nr:sigma-70 family RNA polymerase sigma factor [Phycisphaeraceae bacterium]
MSKTANDIELLKRCLTGSTRSFEVLVQRYQSLVCALTYGATGSVDKSEELAQETFLLAWKNLRQLRDLGKFKAWLCQIARRVIQSWLRTRKRETVGKAALLEKASLEKTAISPTEVAIQQEQQAVVDQAIEIIPEQYRVPLILFYRENKSTREVATIIGLNENTTRQRISRARALLKDQVAAMVETSLAQSKPGKAFTTGVLVSVAGLSIKGAATATAAHAVATGMSALTVKITGIAAGLLLVAGVTYMTVKPKPSNPTPPPTQTQSVPVPSNQTESATVTPQENPDRLDDPIEESPQGTLTTGQAVATDRSPPSSDETQPSYEFEPKGLLSGLITDIETGEPVVDATVRVSNNYIFEAQTDAHGFYSIDKIAQAGQYDIAIDCPPYLGIPVSQDNPVISLNEASHAVKHFQLARACMVEVRVVDVNGVGIKNAKVAATSPTDTAKNEVAYFGEERSTDAKGFVLLGGFAPSKHEYLITVWHNGPFHKREVKGKTISYHSYDYAPEKATVLCTDTNIMEQRTVILKKGQAVHGFVAYADGAPAADVDIIARPTWWHSNWGVYGSPVNDDGTFVLKHITPGAFTITARFADTGSLPVIQAATLPLDNNEPLVLQLTQKSPQALASISGTLQFEGEAQSRYVNIDAYSSRFGHSSCRVQQDAYGHIETEFILPRLEPGPYRLTFSGDAVKQMVLEEVQAPCADLEVTLVTQKTSSVQGTVVDAKTLEPIQSFRARVVKLSTLRGPNYTQKSHWGFFENEQGTFSLDAVGPGVYQAQILAEGYAPALSPEINTDDPEDTIISLSQGGSITGTVTNQQGELLTGAKVTALSLSGGATSSTQTRFMSEEGAVITTLGVFTLNHLPSGVETLKVAHPDYAPAIITTADILEGQIHEGLEIILAAGGALQGTVYDNQGQVMDKEILYVQDAMGYGGSDSEIAGRLATAVTDANGFYKIQHLPSQFCYVKRAQTWNRLGVVIRSVTPADN